MSEYWAETQRTVMHVMPLRGYIYICQVKDQICCENFATLCLPKARLKMMELSFVRRAPLLSRGCRYYVDIGLGGYMAQKRTCQGVSLIKLFDHTKLFTKPPTIKPVLLVKGPIAALRCLWIFRLAHMSQWAFNQEAFVAAATELLGLVPVLDHLVSGVRETHKVHPLKTSCCKAHKLASYCNPAGCHHCPLYISVNSQQVPGKRALVYGLSCASPGCARFKERK